MAVVWSRSTEGVDWEELVRLYAAAPLGNKTAEGLERSFANSISCLSRRTRVDLWGLVEQWPTVSTARISAISRSTQLTKAVVLARPSSLICSTAPVGTILGARCGVLLPQVRIQANDHRDGDLRGPGSGARAWPGRRLVIRDQRFDGSSGRAWSGSGRQSR